MSERLFEPSEVTTRWGVHKATVLRLYHSGSLPGVAISRGRKRTVVRFRPEAILAWEKKKEKKVVAEVAADDSQQQPSR